MPQVDGKIGHFVPARFIPVPNTISAEARAVLERGVPVEREVEPDPRDKEAWRRHVGKSNGFLAKIIAKLAEDHSAEILPHELQHAALYEVSPRNLPEANESRAILYIHGGGFTSGGGIAAAYTAMRIAELMRIKVFSVDYRMPPDHPFPAGLDDVVEAYRWLLSAYKADAIAVYGPSAGGGLAASLVLKIRDIGIQMPAACVLHSPEVDLTESGDSFETNDKIDFILTRLTNSIALYADGHDLKDPYLSPLFGDFSKGFPPTILTSGTRDMFLSNTVLMHRALRRAGLVAELHVWEAMSHGGFFGAAPEDREVYAEQVSFVYKYLGLTEMVSGSA